MPRREEGPGGGAARVDGRRLTHVEAALHILAMTREDLEEELRARSRRVDELKAELDRARRLTRHRTRARVLNRINEVVNRGLGLLKEAKGRLRWSPRHTDAVLEERHQRAELRHL